MLVGVASGLTGCTGGAPDAPPSARWTGSVDTTAGGRVVVQNTGGGAWRRDTVRARRTLLLGEAGISGGSEATTFGDVTGLAVDSRGRIYVGDRIPNTVRAYGPDGEHRGLVGREGRGPGEFRWPNGLAFGPDGWLYVADLSGIKVMGDPTGEGLPTHQIDSWRTVTYAQVYRPFRVSCRGTVYYPHVDQQPTVQMYIRYGRDGYVRDTVRVPVPEGVPGDVPWYRSDPGGGRMVPGVDHPPLAAVPSWDVTPDGQLLIGESSRYRLLVVSSAGDTVRVVRRDVVRRPIPETVRQESIQALRTRLDTLPVPIDNVRNLPSDVADVELPSRYPAHLEVRVGTDGRIWAERPPAPDRPGVTPYDVFGRAGVYLGTVVVPAEFDPGRGYTNARMRPRPVFTGDAVYGVVRDTLTDVQRIARFSYELPQREEGAPPPPSPPCTAADGG